jgi:hypothetical protein
MVIPTLDKERAMTPNHLQFQRGLSLNEFLRDYGTQAQCQAALEKARWPAGYVCPACQSGSHCIVWHGKFNTILSNLKTAISGTYHSFKFKKYAHRYLAEAQYRFNRRFDLSTMLPRLLYAGASTGVGQRSG